VSALASRVEALRARLAERAGVPLADVRAVVSPYRICPLGAHSDHQHGPVLGMAIDAYTLLAFVPHEAAQVELESADFEPRASIPLVAGAPPPEPVWHRYVFGAARVGHTPRGFRACMEGTLPGGGLSSSASAVIAYLLAFSDTNDLALTARELARAAVRVENEFVGVACGALDPACIAGSRRGQLLAIETSPLSWQPVRLGAGAEARFLVVSTGRSRSLAATAFNARVEECHEAARALGRAAGRDMSHLGDLERDVFEAHGAKLSPPLLRRARHFFSERDRVRAGLVCWRRGDLPAFGELMNASCASSIHDYETGSPELVALQALLVETPGVLGARFSGAGFGGCSIALVTPDTESDVIAHLHQTLLSAFGGDPAPRIFSVASEDAAHVL